MNEPIIIISIIIILLVLAIFSVAQFAILLSLRGNTKNLLATYRMIKESQDKFLEQLTQLSNFITVQSKKGRPRSKNPEVLKIEKKFLKQSCDSDRDKSYAFYNCAEALFREEFFQESYFYTKGCLELNPEHQTALKLEKILRRKLNIPEDPKQRKPEKRP